LKAAEKMDLLNTHIIPNSTFNTEKVVMENQKEKESKKNPKDFEIENKEEKWICDYCNSINKVDDGSFCKSTYFQNVIKKTLSSKHLSFH